MRAKPWSFALILTLAIGVSGYALWAYGGGVQRVPVHPDMIKVFNEHRVLITLHAVGASLGEVAGDCAGTDADGTVEGAVVLCPVPGSSEQEVRARAAARQAARRPRVVTSRRLDPQWRVRTVFQGVVSRSGSTAKSRSTRVDDISRATEGNSAMTFPLPVVVSNLWTHRFVEVGRGLQDDEPRAVEVRQRVDG